MHEPLPVQRMLDRHEEALQGAERMLCHLCPYGFSVIYRVSDGHRRTFLVRGKTQPARVIEGEGATLRQALDHLLHQL